MAKMNERQNIMKINCYDRIRLLNELGKIIDGKIQFQTYRVVCSDPEKNWMFVYFLN